MEANRKPKTEAQHAQQSNRDENGRYREQLENEPEASLSPRNTFDDPGVVEASDGEKRHAAEFAEYIRGFEAPSGAAKLKVVAADDQIVSAIWVDDFHTDIEPASDEVTQKAESAGLALVYVSGVSLEWDDLREEDQFFITVG